jgi:hypothetical protein
MEGRLTVPKGTSKSPCCPLVSVDPPAYGLSDYTISNSYVKGPVPIRQLYAYAAVTMGKTKQVRVGALVSGTDALGSYTVGFTVAVRNGCQPWCLALPVWF